MSLPPALRNRRGRPRAQGFTLVELLMVVAVLAILAGLVVPTMGAADRARLRAATRLLAADLEYAQAESMSHGGDPRLVVFDARERSYRVVAASTPDVPITHPGDGQPYETRFGVGRAADLLGVTFRRLALGGDDVLGFGAWGELDQTDAATITLALGDREVTITVTSDTGELSIGEIR
ncbi:MAG: prepilin-type N-terminal cleavage/methylation domain-containing protein [Phycisphaerales bacterium]|nr:prepilin-type N-terminal cleavage/methylation domain-containing protein [Phycisphaerae bacterium]NNF41626.1 prepilin-type N-terminal cleavage/methylation domain-containing protein [Phycisphaerales bacterium]NNM24576.1 prepilin-type N-terminal cleavage/methylation domain-containing protein [Phycisphaerales bacterium]